MSSTERPYKRNCPSCNKELSYKRKSHKTDADKKGSLCYICANSKGGKNFPLIDGKYYRVCPKCNKLNCRYDSEVTARAADKKNTVCKSCSAKNRNNTLDKKLTSRVCPNCNRTVEHKSVYKARAAEGKNCRQCATKKRKKRTYTKSTYKTSVEYKYYFVYETTNIKTGAVYVGVRSTNKLNDGYIGCGVYSDASAQKRSKKTKSHFIHAVVKYGYNSFQRRVLAFFSNAHDAYEYESKLVDTNWVKSGMTYNVSIGGKFSRVVSKYEKYKDEWRELHESGISMNKIAKIYGLSSHASVSLLLR